MTPRKTVKKPKAVKAWMMTNDDFKSEYYSASNAETRAGCIQEHIDVMGVPWEHCRLNGDCPVRVLITKVKP